jgi:hypothetical protein
MWLAHGWSSVPCLVPPVVHLAGTTLAIDGSRHLFCTSTFSVLGAASANLALPTSSGRHNVIAAALLASRQLGKAL